MSAGAYVLGVVLLGVLALPVAWGAVRVRRRMLPQWQGAPARLAESVIGITAVTVVGELLGTVGGFRRYPVVLTCALVGLGMAILGRGPAAPDRGDERPTSLLGRPGDIVAALVCAALVGQYTPRTIAAVRDGISNVDSLKYHLTFAARFFQSHSTTRLPFLGPEFPDTFHPAGTELLHGIGMLLFGRDALSPVINVGWLGLVLLAAWCIGRPFGVAPLSLVGVAIVTAAPVLSFQDAGSAENDLAAICCLLAAVALLLTPGPRGPTTVVGGLAAGLGLGAKLTVAGPIAVLTVAVLGYAIVSPGGSRRLTLVLAWLAPLAGAGSFFYVRNWVRVGTPVPSLDLSVVGLPAPKFATVERFGYSVAHYVGDRSVVRHWYLPGLRHTYGWIWWVTFALAALAVVLSITARGNDRLLRLVGAVAGLGAVIYLVTPTTALGREGQPILFESNTVYLTPSLALALALLALPPLSRRGRRPQAILALLTVVLICTWLTRSLPAWPVRYRVLGVAVALILGVAVLVGRRLTAPLGLAVAVLAFAGYAPLALAFERDAYRHDPTWAWARGLTDVRIAIAGVGPQYPLYGKDLSNRVQYIGVHGPHGEFHDVPTCTQWRHLLHTGGYDYVVVGEDPFRLVGDPLVWMKTDPGATGAFRAGRNVVFRYDPAAPDPACG